MRLACRPGDVDPFVRISQVGEHAFGVLVEMQERAAFAIEDPALLLDQAGQGAELDQQVLHAVQVLVACVPHGFPLNTL